MLHEQRLFFLASSKAIAIAISCVYGRSILTGLLANVINPSVFITEGVKTRFWNRREASLNALQDQRMAPQKALLMLGRDDLRCQ